MVKKKAKKDKSVGKVEAAVEQPTTPTNEDDFTNEILRSTEKANTYYEEVIVPDEIAEQEKRVEEHQKIIKTESDLLKLFNPKTYRKLGLEYKDNLLEFEITPVETTEDIEFLHLDIRTYIDLKELEKTVFEKNYSDETLSKTEKVLYNKVKQKLEKGKQDTDLDRMHKLLSILVTPPSYEEVKNSFERYKKRFDFWKSMPLDLKTFILENSLERLGMDPKVELKLFPTD